MPETRIVCSKCGKSEEFGAALASGWLYHQRADAPEGYMVIRCPAHISEHARRLAGLPQKHRVRRVEDNIERGGLEDTIMQLIANRAALDLEELILLGNTGSGDAYLALMDGVLELTPYANIVNRPAATDITKELFKYAIQKMPTRFLRNRALMKYFVSHHVEMEYRDSIANRATTLGDEKVSAFTPMFAYGVPVQPAALMPDNKIWLSYPDNIVFGIQRDINIEADRDIRRRVLVVVLTMRCALALEEPNAAVIVQGFSDSGLNALTTTTTA